MIRCVIFCCCYKFVYLLLCVVSCLILGSTVNFGLEVMSCEFYYRVFFPYSNVVIKLDTILYYMQISRCRCYSSLYIIFKND